MRFSSSSKSPTANNLLLLCSASPGKLSAGLRLLELMHKNFYLFLVFVSRLSALLAALGTAGSGPSDWSTPASPGNGTLPAQLAPACVPFPLSQHQPPSHSVLAPVCCFCRVLGFSDLVFLEVQLSSSLRLGAQ